MSEKYSVNASARAHHVPHSPSKNETNGLTKLHDDEGFQSEESGGDNEVKD
jgi:hypothetical protein